MVGAAFAVLMSGCGSGDDETAGATTPPETAATASTSPMSTTSADPSTTSVPTTTGATPETISATTPPESTPTDTTPPGSSEPLTTPATTTDSAPAPADSDWTSPFAGLLPSSVPDGGGGWDCVRTLAAISALIDPNEPCAYVPDGYATALITGDGPVRELAVTCYEAPFWDELAGSGQRRIQMDMVGFDRTSNGYELVPVHGPSERWPACVIEMVGEVSLDDEIDAALRGVVVSLGQDLVGGTTAGRDANRDAAPTAAASPACVTIHPRGTELHSSVDGPATSSGEVVRQFQLRLVELGFGDTIESSGGADGYFGPGTTAAFNGYLDRTGVDLGGLAFPLGGGDWFLTPDALTFMKVRCTR